MKMQIWVPSSGCVFVILGFDVELYGINVLFKERAIKQEVSYILCTPSADQTEGTICAGEPWYTTAESKITRKFE